MTSNRMNLNFQIATWLLAGIQINTAPSAAAILLASASAFVLAEQAHAQVEDDEDDDDDDDEAFDDEDILDDDPDEDNDDGAGEDDDDGASEDDDGEPDEDNDGGAGEDDDDGASEDDDDEPGEDNDDGAGEDDDDGASEDDDDGPGEDNDDGAGEDDDDGAGEGGDDGPGGDDDDGAGGDDDDGPSGGDDGPGGDDDNGAGGDDDDDAGGDDDDNGDDAPSARSPGDDDSRGGSGIRGVSPSSGSTPKDPDERPDTRSGSSAGLVDDEGYPLANKNLLTFDLGPTDIALLKEAGFRLLDETKLDGLGASLQRLRPPPGMSLPDAADALRESLPAAPFDYNHVFGLPASDKLEDEGRKIQKVGGTRSGDGVIVAMIDTLVDVSHPSLATRRVVVKDFANTKTGRDLEHATAVASIIVGYDPTAEYRGLVPGATLLAANVFSVSKDGIPETDTQALLKGLDWAAVQGAGVINFSIAGPPSDILEAAIKRLSAKGHIITAAVGNDGPAAPPVYPAAYTNVVGVTAVDIDGKIYRRAGRGDQVDFAAPGVKILAAGPDGSYGAVTGTSFATPVVSALLSLQNPMPGNDAARRTEAFTKEARDLGTSGMDPTFGHGLVQIDIEEVN